MTALSPDSILLTSRVALVTGGAAGIGKGIAEALARFGAQVSICDRNADTLSSALADFEAQGLSIQGAHLDVRQPEAVEKWIGEVGQAFGRIDILVNNVGGTFFVPFMELSGRGVNTLIAENFTSACDVIRCAVPLMPEGSSIVNITSIEGWRAAPGMSIYGAMKAALEGLTRSLALELADRNIRVNCVAPDAIETPGANLVSTTNATEWVLAGMSQTQLGPSMPLRTLGYPDDVAGAVIFYSSDLARLVTGTTIHVDGGTMAAGGWFRREVVPQMVTTVPAG